MASIPQNTKALSSAAVKYTTKPTSAFQLYTAIDFSNMDLVCMIFWIFGNEFPFSFQLLRCSAATMKEELLLFFQRIDMYPDLKYAIMGINNLSMEVQQVRFFAQLGHDP